MLRKNPGCFTDWQVRQLASIDTRRRKLISDAYGEFRRIKDLNLTALQCLQVGEFLGAITTRLIFALRYRQEILTAARRQPFDKILVRMGTLCDCPDNQPRPANDDENETADEELEENLETQLDISSLLELTTQIEERMWTRSTLRGAPLSIFFRHLNRFKLALLKQKKDLEDRIRTPQTQIEVVYDRHKCGGESHEIDGSDE